MMFPILFNLMQQKKRLRDAVDDDKSSILFHPDYDREIFDKNPLRKSILEYVLQDFIIPYDLLKLRFPKSGLSYNEFVYMRYLDGTLKSKVSLKSAIEDPSLRKCDCCGKIGHFRDDCPEFFSKFS